MPAKKPRPVELSSTTLKIEDLADFDESKNILVYGDSGVGKTVFLGGAPNAIFISTENGTIAAKRQGSNAKLIRISAWEDLEVALDYIEKNPKNYEWVLLDSLQQMQRILLKHLLGKGVEEGKKGADLDVPQIQDHQKWQNMFLRFVDRLVDAPVNVMFASTSMRVEGEDDDGDVTEIVLPAIQGKAKEGYAIAQYVCAAMSSVYYMGVERKKGKQNRFIITQKTPPYFAKCRYDVLPDRLVLGDGDPTVTSRIIEKISVAPVARAKKPSNDNDDD